MVNVRQAKTKRMKMAERAQQQLELHFPDYHPAWLWSRKVHDGYSSIPRTLPIVMQAIDMQSKGRPAGHVLFCLWARSPDNPLVVIENPATFAAEAGYTGTRAVDTWRKRMKKLQELCMIQTKPGPSGDFHYVLLLNPNAAMEWMNESGLVQTGVYSRFVDRAMEVGAYGQIEAVREAWAEEHARAAKEAEGAESTSKEVPPPPAEE